MEDTEISKIFHVTCTDSVTDFVKRYLEELKNLEGVKPSWINLKKLLKKRFDDIYDHY